MRVLAGRGGRGQRSYDASPVHLNSTVSTCNDPERQVFENIVGKGGNACNLHSSFSCNIFYPIIDNSATYDLLSVYKCFRYGPVQMIVF